MAYWIFGTNVARIVVIRKLSPIILDILLPKDLFFLQIKLFNRRNTLLSPDSRFSCPMKLAERENFLTSDHLSGARQTRYERGGKKTFAIDSISVKGRYVIIEGWAFVTVAGVSQAPKLLLWHLLKILVHLCVREMRGLMTTAKRRKQEYIARFLFVPFGWVEQSVSTHWQALKAPFFCSMFFG